MSGPSHSVTPRHMPVTVTPRHTSHTVTHPFRGVTGVTLVATNVAMGERKTDDRP